jgi:protein TonB
MHMAYLDTKRGPSAASMAAVIAVHGAIGAALVLGLTVSGVIAPEPDRLILLPDRKVPPPPPPEPQPTEPSAAQPKLHVPVPPIPIPVPRPPVDGTERVVPPVPTPQPGAGDTIGPVTPIPTPSFTPKAATPRTNPAGWVTTDDYRSNWIRQEMTGKARFRLDVAADGRVTNCAITGSSGHPQLDAATCALVSKRAKFQPARGSEGEPVAGSYSNAIDWQLPE